MGDDDILRRELRGKIENLSEQEALWVEWFVDFVLTQTRAEDLSEAGLPAAWCDVFTAHLQGASRAKLPVSGRMLRFAAAVSTGARDVVIPGQDG